MRKQLNWEFWPWQMFYIPILPYLFYKIARSGYPFTQFTQINTSIPLSGMGSESKYATLKLFPEKYTGKAGLISQDQSWTEVLRVLDENQLEFPIIAKPDIGFRGFGVEKILDHKELKSYWDKSDKNEQIILQEYFDQSAEYAIFYYRYPDGNKSGITSFTSKEYLRVLGDGKSSLAELIDKDQRASVYSHQLNLSKENLSVIPKKGEPYELSSIGNHRRGSRFINLEHKITQKLIDRFDELTQHLNGFHYGRFDIKADSIDAIEKEGSFKIIELNGIMGEPVHIYDRSTQNYKKALKTICQHWDLIADISSQVEEKSELHPIRLIQEVKKIRKEQKRLEQKLR